jgi:hypothetical protein
MRPITIEWPAPTTNTIASDALAVEGVPLQLNTNTSVYSPVTGTIQPAYQMATGTVRTIVLSAATGSIAGVSFTLNGLDQNQSLFTETINGDNPVSASFYATILNITPTTAITANVNIGLGTAGTTILQPMDQYNLNNNYSITYSDIDSDPFVLSIVPLYTIAAVQYFNYRDQMNIPTYLEDQTYYFPIPLNNPNVIVTPAGATTSPITGVQYAAINVVGIPLTGLLTSVQVTNTTGFKQTILQQGARF